MKLSLLLAGLPFVMAIEPVNIPLYAYGPGKIGGFAVVNIDGLPHHPLKTHGTKTHRLRIHQWVVCRPAELICF